jgi:hypothetical protein
MPITNRLLGGFVYAYAFQLRQRHGQSPALPLRVHKHVMLTVFFWSRAGNSYDFSPLQR